MTQKIERYRTTASGSLVAISGRHRGISEIDFDWFEEGACIGAVPVFEPGPDPWLVWYCGCHGGGGAPLIPIAADISE